MCYHSNACRSVLSAFTLHAAAPPSPESPMEFKRTQSARYPPQRSPERKSFTQCTTRCHRFQLVSPMSLCLTFLLASCFYYVLIPFLQILCCFCGHFLYLVSVGVLPLSAVLLFYFKKLLHLSIFFLSERIIMEIKSKSDEDFWKLK